MNPITAYLVVAILMFTLSCFIMRYDDMDEHYGKWYSVKNMTAALVAALFWPVVCLWGVTDLITHYWKRKGNT